MKQILQNKPKHIPWIKFLSEKNILEDFMNYKLTTEETHLETAYRVINGISDVPRCLCGNPRKLPS
jgi:hypothetical protein